jgi:phosphate:Na+ symporter
MLMIDLSLIFTIAPALILFLYGIEHFSREILRIAGERFRSILGKVTANRFGGALLGAIVTATVQSSTATTVIVVGLVDAGIITFTQSIGVIIGANVGTTVTAQLVAFKLTAIAPFFIIIGFLLSLFGRHYRFLGKPIFYFGLVFFSLDLMSNAIGPLKSDPEIVSLFAEFSNVFLAIVAGVLFTVIVQSSSVTTGIAVLLVGSGLLSLDQGIPLVMGANIGTTLTSFLAALKLDIYAKRAAFAHFLFNFGGVLLFIPFLYPFSGLIISIGGGPAQQMANAHLVFNLIAAAIFLVVLKPFSEVVVRLVPGKDEEILFRPKYLNHVLPESNEEACGLIGQELSHSLKATKHMFDYSLEILLTGTDKNLHKVEKLEALNDYLDDVISAAILELSRRKLSKRMGRKVVLLVRMSNATEQLGDLAKNLAIESGQIAESGRPLSQSSLSNVRNVYSRFSENLSTVAMDAPSLGHKSRQSIRKNDRILRDMITTGYRDHLNRMVSQKAYAGSSFVEVMSVIESSNAKLREIRKLAESYSRVQ